MILDFSHKMVLYSVWSNCCNQCDFCLRKERDSYSLQRQKDTIRSIRENIKHIDWENEYSYGISLLGGELYYITHKELQHEFLLLIDDIINYILKKSRNPLCKFSTVTNGLYDPTFLFQVVDKIITEVGIEKIDINFSYDLKYRYKNEDDRIKVLNNINSFHTRYDYTIGVQMILTKYLIQMIKENKFSITDFETNQAPGSVLTFLYPHPIHTGKKLDDFFFSREEFLWLLQYLKNNHIKQYINFIHSTKNSAVFKYTGIRLRDCDYIDNNQQPVLSDGKEVINNKCGHSTLYQCYNNSDKCMLCDIKIFDSDI